MAVNKLKVLSNRQVSQRYWHMIVDSSVISEEINPGQFFNVKCNGEISPLLRRPLSIYSINKKEKTIEFLYLVKGEGTQKLRGISPGEELDVFGPLGKGFKLSNEMDMVLLLARGVGIATLAAVAQKANEKNIKSIAVLSARTRNDLLAAETLQELGAQVYIVTDEDRTSEVEQVSELLIDIFEKNSIKAAFTCGSKRLSKLLKTIAKQKNIPAQIALEEHMGCAMGVCYACVCDIEEEGIKKSVRVCKDGPVFDLDKVVLN